MKLLIVWYLVATNSSGLSIMIPTQSQQECNAQKYVLQENINQLSKLVCIKGVIGQ